MRQKLLNLLSRIRVVIRIRLDVVFPISITVYLMVKYLTDVN